MSAIVSMANSKNFNQPEMTKPAARTDDGQLKVLQDLMAGAEITPAQLASTTNWSPEKRLASAVLSAALLEIRTHAGDPRHRRRIQEDLEWVFSDDREWPFSFLRLCDLFDLDVDWVRETVGEWMESGSRGGRRPVLSYAA